MLCNIFCSLIGRNVHASQAQKLRRYQHESMQETALLVHGDEAATVSYFGYLVAMLM